MGGVSFFFAVGLLILPLCSHRVPCPRPRVSLFRRRAQSPTHPPTQPLSTPLPPPVHCRSQVCRTYHFGFEGGASAGQFNAHLKNIQLSQDVVDWAHEDLA